MPHLTTCSQINEFHATSVLPISILTAFFQANLALAVSPYFLSLLILEETLQDRYHTFLQADVLPVTQLTTSQY